MTKTPHDSLILNSCKNVQLKTEWGGYVQMQLRGTERLAPPGGPHTRRSSRRRRFSFGSQITFNGLRSCTLRSALPPQSHNNFPFAPIRTLGRLCLSASNIAKRIFSCISRPINNFVQTRGFEVKIMVEIRCQTVPLWVCLTPSQTMHPRVCRNSVGCRENWK